MFKKTDMWQVAIVRQSAASLAKENFCVDFHDLIFLPALSKSFCFLADPMALWVDHVLHIFVEYYDYRFKKGLIRLYTYDQNLQFQSYQDVLKTDFHLSFPFVWQEDKTFFLHPEQHRSGHSLIYQSLDLQHWEPYFCYHNSPMIDPITYGPWVLFSLPCKSGLYYRPHAFHEGPEEPEKHLVLEKGLRLAGPVFTVQSQAFIPLQYGEPYYGKELRIYPLYQDKDKIWIGDHHQQLKFKNLPSNFVGCHSFSSAQDVCLIDLLQHKRSPWRSCINLQRRLNRLFRIKQK